MGSDSIRLNCDVFAFHHTSGFHKQLQLSSDIFLGLELKGVCNCEHVSSAGHIFTK